jgi:catalase
LSSASVFSGQKIPVIVRFSVGGGNPKAADNAKSQRNMALQFNLPGDETWQMGNISAPVFGSSTPAQLLGRLESLTPDPSTKAPNPEKVKAFAEANPEVLLQGKYFASQPVPASFASVNYWGVNAFAFVNGKGEKQFGKWIFEPSAGVMVSAMMRQRLRDPISCSMNFVNVSKMAKSLSISTFNWRSLAIG